MAISKVKIKKQLSLQIMMAPGTILLIIFSLFPMVGIWMAFSKYQPIYGQGYFTALFKGEFVGLGFFAQIFSRPDFLQVLFNTVFISFTKIVLLLALGLTLALLLNELTRARFKKAIQTIVFIPYFISWAILATMLIDILSLGGAINKLLISTGLEPISFLSSNKWFRTVLFASELWKNLGYQAIYFLAAIATVDTGLYEAAQIDGANRVQQCFKITIPCISPIIILMTVLNLGNIMNAGFEQVFSLYSEMVYETGDIIDTMAYRVGLINASAYQYSLGTAIGLFKSVISSALFLVGYFIAAKKLDYKVL